MKYDWLIIEIRNFTVHYDNELGLLRVEKMGMEIPKEWTGNVISYFHESRQQQLLLREEE
jgi:hypothetical protein